MDSLGALNRQIFWKTIHTNIHTYIHTWPEPLFYRLLDSGFAPSTLSRVVQKTPTLEIENRSSGFPWFQTSWVQWCTKKYIFSTFRGREFKFKFFENAWEVKKSKCENHIKLVSKICKMRRFKIWHHNSNRIRFDPFFATKLSEIGKIPDLAYFDSFFFAEKCVKSYPIGILRPDLESSHHFAYFRH